MYSYWGLKPQEKVLEDVINGIEDESSYLDISEESIPEYVGDHLILPRLPAQKRLLTSLWLAGFGKISMP
ncbi:hypothetical protein EBB07_10450 [Paenibacillaceae bacterium]|nr:hypothetical protein EBB07_10450 [Paenibacillaceae bacterium]